jgi:uncharacterized membrane protein YcaP (DUF421 family)
MRSSSGSENCGLAILTVVLVHDSIAWAKSRWPRLGVLVDGTPLVLLEDGEWRLEVMRGMRVAPEDVMAAARAKGIRSIRQVKYAVLERTGAVSIIPRDTEN